MSLADFTSVDAQRQPLTGRWARLRTLCLARPADSYGLLVILITLAVYARALTNQFVDWDDHLHITKNSPLVNISWESLSHFWREPYFGLYIPVTYTFWLIEAALSQLLSGQEANAFNPIVYHAGSVLLHVGCVVVVLHLLQTLLGNWNGAFWGACVFSLHPLQVESVAWASETKGLLAALLGFLAILILQRHRTGAVNPKAEALACELRAGDSTAGNKRLCYALASGCFLLALLSKPSAVAIPLIVIAIDKLWWQVPWRRTLAVSAPWLVVAAAFVLVTRGAQAVSLPAFSPPWWARLLIAGDTIAFYLAKLVWPWRLGFDYGRDPQTVLNGDWVYAACLIPAALALLAAGRSRLRPFGTALAIFLAGMSPVLGLTSFAFQKYSTVADRYMYIPMLGAAFWVAWLMTQHGSQRIWRALSFLLLGMLALQSVRQISVWHDTLTLAAHGLQVNPISTPANCFYGTSLKGAGKYAEAVKYFSQACKTHPDDIVSRLDLASCLIEIGDLEEAQRQIKEAQARWPPVLEVMPERKAEFEAAMARKRRADSTTGPVEAHLP